MVALNSILQDPNFALFGSGGAVVSSLDGAIDSYPEEYHSYTLSTTQYPIETGARLTDHAYLEPRRLTLKGIVSDILAPGGPGKPRQAWAAVQAAMDTREPVTVVTLLDTYPDMLITGAYPNVTRSTGGALVFDMTLEQVLFANTQTVALPPEQVDGPAENKTSEVEGGTKQSTAPTAQESSLLNSTLGGLF